MTLKYYVYKRVAGKTGVSYISTLQERPEEEGVAYERIAIFDSKEKADTMLNAILGHNEAWGGQ